MPGTEQELALGVVCGIAPPRRLSILHSITVGFTYRSDSTCNLPLLAVIYLSRIVVASVARGSGRYSQTVPSKDGRVLERRCRVKIYYYIPTLTLLLNNVNVNVYNLYCIV